MIKECSKCGRRHPADYNEECLNRTCGADLSRRANYILVEEQVEVPQTPTPQLPLVEEVVREPSIPVKIYYKNCPYCHRYYPFSVNECSCQEGRVKLVNLTEGLVLKHNESSIRIIVKPVGSHSFGRLGEYAHYFQFHEISRTHFIITFTDGYPRIRDNNSTNGTFLNTKRLTPGQDYLLKSGDLLKVGITAGYSFMVG